MTGLAELVGANMENDNIVVRSDVLHHLVDGVGHLDPDEVDPLQP